MEDHRLCSRKLGAAHQFRQSKLRDKTSAGSTVKQPHGGHPSKPMANRAERGEKQSGLRDKA
jgi:hypothetical protein